MSQNEPSARAIRAARAIDLYIVIKLGVPLATIRGVAEIIDRESGLKELTAALTKLADPNNYDADGWIADSDPMTIATLALAQVDDKTGGGK